MEKIIKRKRFITLIEIMIVMFLIAMITGVIAFNYRGSLDEGKAFKTRTAIDKLETILALAQESGDLSSDVSNWREMVDSSPLVQNPTQLKKDGWGYPYSVDVREGRIVIVSEKYNEYMQKNGKTSLFKTDPK